MRFPAAAVFALGLFMAPSAHAATVAWTDWVEAGATTVTGAIGAITVTYEGPYSFAQLGTGTNYWTEGDPAPYTGNSLIDNAPTPSEMVALDSGGTHTITFSEAVLNPILAILSLGRPNDPVTYTFDQDFTVLGEGRGYWGDGSYTKAGTALTGNELHGVIQFTGLVTSISWVSSPNEYWHGVTVGTVPLPAALPLMLTAFGMAGFLGWRRRQSA